MFDRRGNCLYSRACGFVFKHGSVDGRDGLHGLWCGTIFRSLESDGVHGDNGRLLFECGNWLDGTDGLRGRHLLGGRRHCVYGLGFLLCGKISFR